MTGLLRAIDRLVVSVSLGIATLLLALMSCVTFYQVLTRFIFENPSTWSEVTARSLMIWMVYLGLVAVLRAGALIAIDLIFEVVPAAVRRVLSAVLAAVTLCVLGVMIWYGTAMAWRVSGQTLAGLTDPLTGKSISIGLVYAAIPVGAALSVIAVLARLAEELRGEARAPDAAETVV